jgi:predicted transcriptional regulator
MPGPTAGALEQAAVSGAPVVDRGRVVGVVTLRDLIAPALTTGASVQTTGPFLRYEHHLAARAGPKIEPD